MVKGYWGDEAATKAVFVDGWFHSGDVGYVDADGYVYVVDRIKDVVIRGGENVYCAEVEAVLFEHPDIAEVAVVGPRLISNRVTRTGYSASKTSTGVFSVFDIATWIALGPSASGQAPWPPPIVS